MNREIEEQRLGRDKNTTIDHNYIDSGKFKRKFDNISNSDELNKVLYDLAKKMLYHRSGTKFEDMYWIDLATNKVIAQELDTAVKEEISYSRKTKKVIKKYENLITIHSHPNSYPPSLSDFNSNYSNEYFMGIVICHDGRLYLYSSNEKISKKYYELRVARFINDGFNENDAQLCVLKELREKFDIQFKEVMDI